MAQILQTWKSNLTILFSCNLAFVDGSFLFVWWASVRRALVGKAFPGHQRPMITRFFVSERGQFLKTPWRKIYFLRLGSVFGPVYSSNRMQKMIFKE